MDRTRWFTGWIELPRPAVDDDSFVIAAYHPVRDYSLEPWNYHINDSGRVLPYGAVESVHPPTAVVSVRDDDRLLKQLWSQGGHPYRVHGNRIKVALSATQSLTQQGITQIADLLAALVGADSYVQVDASFQPQGIDIPLDTPDQRWNVWAYLTLIQEHEAAVAHVPAWFRNGGYEAACLDGAYDKAPETV
jgi:hypothetical protein